MFIASTMSIVFFLKWENSEREWNIYNKYKLDDGSSFLSGRVGTEDYISGARKGGGGDQRTSKGRLSISHLTFDVVKG